MSKGSQPRPYNPAAFDSGWSRIFGKKDQAPAGVDTLGCRTCRRRFDCDYPEVFTSDGSGGCIHHESGTIPLDPAPGSPDSPGAEVLWRSDDGVEFSRNEDGTYSMDSSIMHKPHRYTFGRLMDTGKFQVYPPIPLDPAPGSP